MQEKGWGYVKVARHLTDDEVWERLKVAAAQTPANLLLNTGPMEHGVIHPEDSATLRRVGLRLTKEGFPQA